MDFLAIGTFWFWLAALVTLIVITFCIEKEESSGWGAFLTCVAFLALLYFFGSREPVVSMLSYAVHNPIAILLMAGLYLFLGSAWSIVKWFFFIKESKNKQWEEHVSYNSRRSEGEKTKWDPDIPTARKNKSTIMMWMSWWPFSLAWTMVNDPIRKAFRSIYMHLEATYDRMAEKIMKAE